MTGAAGPTTAAFDRAAGAHDLDVPIASRPTLDRALRRGAAELWVRVTVTDPAGNRGSRLASVRLGSGTLDWPLQRPALSSRFGVRWGRMHEGVDLAAKPGSRIRAADGGVVVRAGWWGGYGNVVVIDHGTRTTLYGHQSRLAVRKRQVVARGQVIGYVGSTGHSTGPHLHFELRIGGELAGPARLPAAAAPADRAVASPRRTRGRVRSPCVLSGARETIDAATEVASRCSATGRSSTATAWRGSWGAAAWARCIALRSSA